MEIERGGREGWRKKTQKKREAKRKGESGGCRDERVGDRKG